MPNLPTTRSTRQTHSTATKVKASKAKQKAARNNAQLARLAAKGVPAPTLQALQKRGARAVGKIAKNNPRPTPATNRHTPALPSKRNPKGTALGIARLQHTYSLKNGAGNYVTQVAYPLATCTAHNPQTGVYTFIVKQRGNTPAQLLNLTIGGSSVHPASSYVTGYAFVCWVA